MRIAIPMPSTAPAIASQKRGPSPSSSAETERAIVPSLGFPGVARPHLPGVTRAHPGPGDARPRGAVERGRRSEVSASPIQVFVAVFADEAEAGEALVDVQ